MITRQMKSHESGEFFFTWTFACLVGSVAGLAIGIAVTNFIWPSPALPPNTQFNMIFMHEIFFYQVIVGLSIGFFTGILEWLVLRSYLPNTGRWWILTSMGIWTIFPAAIYALSSSLWPLEIVIQPGLTGTALGIAQWFFLRRLVPKAGWWILARAVSSFVSFFSVTLNPNIDAVIFRGLIVGAITGLVLIFLLEQPSFYKNQ